MPMLCLPFVSARLNSMSDKLNITMNHVVCALHLTNNINCAHAWNGKHDTVACAGEWREHIMMVGVVHGGHGQARV